MEKTPYIINAHTHCFTIEHVPDNFTKSLTRFSWLLSIKWIKNNKIVRWIIYLLNKPRIKKFLSIFFSAEFVKTIPRLLSFAEYYDIDKQVVLIRHLQGFYPMGTKFVLLTMDMEFMNAGVPIQKFDKQLSELVAIKADPLFRDIIYPFVFADPRRAGITQIVIDRLEDSVAPFQGIKLYPALGYYPFDERLKEVYKYAIQHDTPIITHCIRGSVYYRGNKTDDPTYLKHPYTNRSLPFEKPVDFTVNFTHPYNYECLLNPERLRKVWKEEPNIDLSKLKICLGHFGGEDEWIKYLEEGWIPDEDFLQDAENTLDVLTNPWYDEPDTPLTKGKKAYSWFSVICELMRKYPNVYADISYSLYEERILPLLKVILESDNSANGIASRILFGTDFYVVSKAGAEREMSLSIRAFLGEKNFRRIAYENPNKFLNI